VPAPPSTANLLDVQINGPHGPETNYGDPKNSFDQDTGQKVEDTMWPPASPRSRIRDQDDMRNIGRCLGIGLILAAGIIVSPSHLRSGSRQACSDFETMQSTLRPKDRSGSMGARAREFLWLHWSEKKCARLDLTTWSREGERTVSQYSIDFDEAGASVLRVTLSRDNDPSGPVSGLAVPDGVAVQRQLPSSNSYEAYTVERVTPTVPFVAEDAKPIPSGKQVKATRYLLRFKDKTGKVLTTF